VNLAKRIGTTFTLVTLIGGTLFYLPLIYFSLGVSVFSCLGLYEYLQNLKKKGIQVYRVFGIAMGVILPLVIHFQYGQTQAGEVLFLILACFSLFILQFLRKENPRALEGISLTFFGIMYIGWFLSHLIKLRYLPDGAIWIGYLFVVTKMSDVSAFAIGSWIGKHRLIEHISPKKTVEGTIGGLLGSALISTAFISILPVAIPVMHLVLMGLAIGFVGQCGDLSVSLIKRYCAIKDSGVVFPGFGGILDVIDSILFTIPLFYFYLATFIYPVGVF